MERAPEECILCNGRKRDLLIEIESWQVKRCRDCGLGVLDPRPSPEELARLYDQAYCDARFVEGGAPGTPEFHRRIRLESHRIDFFRKLKPKGKVLDIGCGYGYFLAACRERGYGVHGLDFSEWAIDHARNLLGLPITISPLDGADLPLAEFDVVTLWHSLEHMPDPRIAIERAATWLKPDGLLVIDVPNHAGTDAKKMGRIWNGWDLPYHFFHFTPETLSRFLHRYGFRVVRKKDYHSEAIKAAIGRIPIFRPVARPIAKFYSGHSIAVAARRDAEG
jgi:SAM-dependent methyltransferase